jgi:hypothetical protein
MWAGFDPLYSWISNFVPPDEVGDPRGGEMARQLNRPSATLARRHVLKLGGCMAAQIAAVAGSALSSSARAGATATGINVGVSLPGINIGIGLPPRPRPTPVSPKCFLKGTRILTPEGEVAIEDLSIGDEVVTVASGVQPIKWIGRQSFRRSGRRWLRSVNPIRIAANAIQDGMPRRDLYLSPSHAIGVDGMLLTAGFLINGRTVQRADMTDATVLDYFHIELETHELVIADGLPSESFFSDDPSREQFANFAEHDRLYGSGSRGPGALPLPVTYYQASAAARGLLAFALSPLVTIDDPMQRAFDRVAARSLTHQPAA